MKDPATLKIIIYTSLAIFSVVGTVLGIGVWIGKKNSDSEEIDKLKQQVETNEAKARARLYTPDGNQIFMRAGYCEKLHSSIRADLSEVEKKQQIQEITLVSIDSNVKMLVSLIKDVLKIKE